MSRLGGLAGAAAIALLAAGCGSGSGSESSTTRRAATSSASRSSSRSGSRSTPSRTRSTPRTRPSIAGAPVGRTRLVHAGDSRLDVTVTRVYDPLPRAGVHPAPGTRPVGAALTIVNVGGGTYDSTASGDVSLVLSSGQAAPLFAGGGPCQTPLTDFESLIGGGETRGGCVAFSVPHGARVLAVRFSPHSRAPGTVTWRVH